MKTDLLKPHPLNASIYGKADPRELVESVKRLGVLEPIVYSRTSLNGKEPHYYILSGQRRWLAAKAVGLKDVPTREVHLDGPEAERFLIEANRQRVKTKGQRLREYKKLKEIEAKLAKTRESEAGKAGGLRKGSANLHDPGRADSKAAAKVGLKPRTAEKGLRVLELAETGDRKAIQALDALDQDEISVDRAYRETVAKPPPPDTESREAIALAALEETDELLGKAVRAVKRYLDNRAAIEDRDDEKKFLRRLTQKIQGLLAQVGSIDSGKEN